MHIRLPPAFRVWRLVRKWPLTVWREFWAPLWNRDQFLALLVALVGTVLVLRTASDEKVIEETSGWALSLEAFGWALLIWAALMAFRAPFVIIAAERAIGSWHGRRFVYHRPELVAVLRCKATGQPQFHPFNFEDAEPEAFVNYWIEVEGDPPKHLFTAHVVSGIVTSPYMTEPGVGAGQGGTRIGKDRSASLLIVMKPEMVSQTVRVYMRDFSIGNPEDQDGDEGEFREAFQRTAVKDDRT